MLYGLESRPGVCSSFQCAWLRGWGLDEDRPDVSGVLLSINEMNGGRWVFAVETKKDAVLTSGRNIVIDIAFAVDIPVIVVDHGSTPPNDTGDRVVVKDKLLARSKAIIGSKLNDLAPGIAVYTLVK